MSVAPSGPGEGRNGKTPGTWELVPMHMEALHAILVSFRALFSVPNEAPPNFGYFAKTGTKKARNMLFDPNFLTNVKKI